MLEIAYLAIRGSSPQVDKRCKGSLVKTQRCPRNCETKVEARNFTRLLGIKTILRWAEKERQ